MNGRKYINPLIIALIIGNIAVVKAQVNPNSQNLNGANSTAIFTAVPFLRIGPDARSGGMGDLGVALSPDANSIYWNTAKLAFADKQFGIGVSYTPWLRELVNDIYLADVSGYYKIDNTQAIAVSLRYFSLGQIQFTNSSGAFIENFNPREYCANVGYARKIADNFSIGLNLGYINSNLAAGQQVNGAVIKAAQAADGDLSCFYTHEIKEGGRRDTLNWGITISNLGSKITYTQSAQTKDFIPTTLSLGLGYTFVFDRYNKLTVIGEVSKLLVPLPDSSGDFRQESVPEGVINSFTNAPGGLATEFHELMFSMGSEYWYRNLFALRGGFFDEYKYMGDRKYFTAGIGIKYSTFGLNFSYLIPATYTRNPLDNTLRFSFIFEFDKGKGAKADEDRMTE
jgi:hypothetical protein